MDSIISFFQCVLLFLLAIIAAYAAVKLISPDPSSDKREWQQARSGYPTSNTGNPQQKKAEYGMAHELNGIFFTYIDRHLLLKDIPRNMESVVFLWISFFDLMTYVVKKVNLSDLMIAELHLELHKRYPDANLRTEIPSLVTRYYEKKQMVSMMLDAEYAIRISDLHSAPEYLERYAEHIMLYVFALSNDTVIAESLTESYNDIAELTTYTLKKING